MLSELCLLIFSIFATEPLGVGRLPCKFPYQRVRPLFPSPSFSSPLLRSVDILGALGD